MWNLFTNNEVRKERMAICNTCEFKSEKYLLIFNGAGCSICKCPLSSITKIKAKVCPKKKW
jgi:hypothetical protein|tara:strand:- start:152 stop:334 length:183 start_codon:yes stop_codon:yes gene_type:complete